MNKGFIYLGAVITISLIAVILAGLMLSLPKNEPVACTMEAKQCPDGSYVGRGGPKCEFAPCPTGAAAINTPTWVNYRNDEYGFEVKYPCHDPKLDPRVCPLSNGGEPNSGYAFDIDFPTTADSTSISIKVFNKASTEEWDRMLRSTTESVGDAQSFPYNIQELSNALKLSVGQECGIAIHCEVVLFGNSKALQVVNNYRAGYTLEYMFPHGMDGLTFGDFSMRTVALIYTMQLS